MFEALKGTGKYPDHRAVVCCCWDRQLGYWYVVENTEDGVEGLAAQEPMYRAKRIVSLLPDTLQAEVTAGNPHTMRGDAAGRRVTLCSLVDAAGMNLHTVHVLALAFEDGPPDAEATCRRLVELLNGAK